HVIVRAVEQKPTLNCLGVALPISRRLPPYSTERVVWDRLGRTGRKRRDRLLRGMVMGMAAPTPVQGRSRSVDRGADRSVQGFESRERRPPYASRFDSVGRRNSAFRPTGGRKRS